MIFESVFACLDFHDLDFVEAPAAPGPRKSGVGVWISVGLKVSCSHAMFFVFVEAVLVFSRNASTKCEAPPPPGQFLEVYIYPFGGWVISHY
jgi:hypothetical protein